MRQQQGAHRRTRPPRSWSRDSRPAIRAGDLPRRRRVGMQSGAREEGRRFGAAPGCRASTRRSPTARSHCWDRPMSVRDRRRTAALPALRRAAEAGQNDSRSRNPLSVGLGDPIAGAACGMPLLLGWRQPTACAECGRKPRAGRRGGSCSPTRSPGRLSCTARSAPSGSSARTHRAQTAAGDQGDNPSTAHLPSIDRRRSHAHTP
jgi:hypothetical protein